jgi:hypothetical protein
MTDIESATSAPAAQATTMLSAERLIEVLALIKGADTVESKVSVQETQRYAAISALGSTRCRPRSVKSSSSIPRA